jgi:hypothetical protein
MRKSVCQEYAYSSDKQELRRQCDNDNKDIIEELQNADSKQRIQIKIQCDAAQGKECKTDQESKDDDIQRYHDK